MTDYRQALFRVSEVLNTPIPGLRNLAQRLADGDINFNVLQGVAAGCIQLLAEGLRPCGESSGQAPELLNVPESTTTETPGR